MMKMNLREEIVTLGNKGFSTRMHFYQMMKKVSCQLFQKDLFEGKFTWGKSGKEAQQDFPFGCPGGKDAKKNSFPKGYSRK